MSATWQNALPYVTGAFFVLALLLFLVSFRLFRRSRTDVFWRRRRDAGQRGWRLFVLAFALIVLSGVSCTLTLLVSLFAGDEETTPVATELAGQGSALNPVQTAATPLVIQPSPTGGGAATPPPDQTLSPLVSPTPVVVIITTTPIHTPTETLFPTFTPNVPPPVSSVTPLPGAQISITALDDQISDALTPVNPRATFDAGTKRIYLFVQFRGMAQGVLWKRILYRDGAPIDSNTYLWGLETAGASYFFFGNDNGFEPGNYEIRLFIGEGDIPTSIIPFMVLPTQ